MLVKDPNYFNEKVFEDLSRKHDVYGFNYTLIKNGVASKTKAYGLKNNSPEEKMSSSTIFEAASLTKSLFATLVLRFIDRGLFTLDDPISKLAPEIVITKDKRIEEITIRQILSHASGLPNWGSKPNLKFLFNPGIDFSYSGEGYYFLQKILEKITSKDFCSHFYDEFIRPLSMDNSTPVWEPLILENESHTFSDDGKAIELRDCIDTSGNAPEPNAAWSLYSGAEDYSKFMLEILNNQGHLSSTMYHEMVSPQSQATEHVYWGLGFGIPARDQNVIWHWGDNGGYKHLAVMDVKTKDGMCIFTNGFNGIDLSTEFLDLVTDSTFTEDIAYFIEIGEK